MPKGRGKAPRHGHNKTRKQHPQALPAASTAAPMATPMAGIPAAFGNPRQAALVASVQGELERAHGQAARATAAEVIPGFLWLGSKQDACDADFLLRNNITFVLNCAGAGARGTPADFACEYEQLNAVDDYQFQIIRRSSGQGLNFLRQAAASALAGAGSGVGSGGRVLVHCMSGVNRSAAIVAAYLMREHGKSALEAVRQLAAVRPQVLTNSSFVEQLVQFQLESEDKAGKASATTATTDRDDPFAHSAALGHRAQGLERRRRCQICTKPVPEDCGRLCALCAGPPRQPAPRAFGSSSAGSWRSSGQHRPAASPPRQLGGGGTWRSRPRPR